MNFALSDEQLLMRDAARAALAGHATLDAARAALDGQLLPDLWPTAIRAGWPGLLVPEPHGGAGLQALEAMLVLSELGRGLAATGLLGHLPATALVSAASGDDHRHALLEPLAAGSTRAALIAALPPADAGGMPTVEPLAGRARGPAPRVDGHGRVTGLAPWVPDAPGADVLVVTAVDGDGASCVVLVPAAAAVVEPVRAYDASRPLGHVSFDAAPGERLDVPTGAPDAAWQLTQALIGAEALGAVERLLELTVEHARRRFAFGRAIGSFQAIKHQLVEVLRRLENARSLVLYAGWAQQHAPQELGTAAAALRFVAGDALDFASRTAISVHGGMGTTWEHDASLYFRRAQLTRRLLGSHDGGAEQVAADLFAAAARAG